MPRSLYQHRRRFPVRTTLRAALAVLVFLIPGLVLMSGPAVLAELSSYERFWELPLRVLAVFALSWKWIWTAGSAVEILLTLLLVFCGGWAWHLLGTHRYTARSQS